MATGYGGTGYGGTGYGGGSPSNSYGYASPYASGSPYSGGSPYASLGSPYASGSPYGDASPYSGNSPYSGAAASPSQSGSGKSGGSSGGSSGGGSSGSGSVASQAQAQAAAAAQRAAAAAAQHRAQLLQGANSALSTASGNLQTCRAARARLAATLKQLTALKAKSLANAKKFYAASLAAEKVRHPKVRAAALASRAVALKHYAAYQAAFAKNLTSYHAATNRCQTIAQRVTTLQGDIQNLQSGSLSMYLGNLPGNRIPAVQLYGFHANPMPRARAMGGLLRPGMSNQSTLGRMRLRRLGGLVGQVSPASIPFGRR